MESEGRRLHAEAAKAREEDKFFASLGFNDQALDAYDRAGDTLGFAEGIACRSITLRVHAGLQDSRNFLTLAKYEMMGSVAIARESGEKTALAMPLYNLAQLEEDLGDFEGAVTTYREAVTSMEQNPPPHMDRPSVLANMKVHMTGCEYKAGDKSAHERALAALQELKDADEPSQYNKDVWVSGGYLRLAEALYPDDRDTAKEYMEQARAIIDANPELTLRRKQYEKLAATFA